MSTWHCHSQYMGQKVKELTSHQSLSSSPTTFKPFLHQGSMMVLQVMWEMRAKVMVGLFVGLQKDDPGTGDVLV